jgi:biotin carboxyl carrier protein
MRKLSVKIEGKERVVEIDEGRVVVDGAVVDVEILEPEAGMYLLRRGTEQTVARVDGSGAKVSVSVRRAGGDPIVVAAEVVDARRAHIVAPTRVGADTGEPVSIRSPIPGRVVKVLVKAGDKVAAGQTAVVLEAMKMENELRAPRAGTVVEVRCTEGTAVEAGQDLVSMR